MSDSEVIRTGEGEFILIGEKGDKRVLREIGEKPQFKEKELDQSYYPDADACSFGGYMAYGTTSFTIKDGDKEYRYNINIYEDDLGTSRIDIISQ